MQNIKTSTRNVALAAAGTNTLTLPVATLVLGAVHNSGAQVRAHYHATQAAVAIIQASVDGTNWVTVATSSSAVENTLSFPFMYPFYRATVTMGATAGTLNLFGIMISAA
jgi:hypothetical protein